MVTTSPVGGPAAVRPSSLGPGRAAEAAPRRRHVASAADRRRRSSVRAAGTTSASSARRRWPDRCGDRISASWRRTSPSRRPREGTRARRTAAPHGCRSAAAVGASVPRVGHGDDVDFGDARPRAAADASPTAPGVSPCTQIESTSHALSVPSTASTVPSTASRTTRAATSSRVVDHGAGLAAGDQRAGRGVGAVGEATSCTARGRRRRPRAARRAGQPQHRQGRVVRPDGLDDGGGLLLVVDDPVVERAVRLHVPHPAARSPAPCRRARRAGRAPRRSARRGRRR